MTIEHSPIQQVDGAPLKPISVTVPVALAITGVGRTKLYGLIAAGTLRTAKVGSRTLINYADLERMASGQAASVG